MSANHSQAAYRGQPSASWESIFRIAAKPGIINFDISLKAGGIISYLGLDTIFLSDLNLETWSDRLGTWGGEEDHGRARRGYGSSSVEDKLGVRGASGGSVQGGIRLTSIPIGGSHHRVLWEKDCETLVPPLIGCWVSSGLKVHTLQTLLVDITFVK